MDQLDHSDVTRQLEDIGLSAHEAQLYLEILRFGEASVGMLLKNVKLHREQAYRALKHLEEAMLVRRFVKRRRAYFAATDPEILIRRVQAKVDVAESLQPLLKGMYQHHPHVIQVREGAESFEALFEDILREFKDGGEYLILGGQGEQFYRLDEIRPMYQKYANLYAKKGISLRMLSFEGQDFTTQYWTQPLLEVRELPGSYAMPVATVIYGNKVAMEVMDPERISIITIENEHIADAYRQQFEALWEIGRTVPRPVR
jgi:predicted transcriptional regulator